MESYSLLISVVTIICSGFGAYLGVVVALTKVQGDIKRHEDKFIFQDKRLDRLENKIFD